MTSRLYTMYTHLMICGAGQISRSPGNGHLMYSACFMCLSNSKQNTITSGRPPMEKNDETRLDSRRTCEFINDTPCQFSPSLSGPYGRLFIIADFPSVHFPKAVYHHAVLLITYLHTYCVQNSISLRTSFATNWHRSFMWTSLSCPRLSSQFAVLSVAVQHSPWHGQTHVRSHFATMYIRARIHIMITQ